MYCTHSPRGDLLNTRVQIPPQTSVKSITFHLIQQWLRPHLKRFHFCRVLNITFAFPGEHNLPKQISPGTPFPSSNLTSYVATIGANSALSPLTAKNRPGLIPNGDGDRLNQASKTSCRSAYHECRPYPKNKCSLDVDAA